MSDAPLILVTRTGVPGRVLCERLSACGFRTLHGAPVELSGPADPGSVSRQLRRALPADRVVMTSRQAVQQAVGLAGGNSFRGLTVVVPGPGTAAAARELGLERVVCPPQAANSEAMLALPELTDVTGRRIILLAAEGGRRLLEQELEQRGAQVERIHVYRRLSRSLSPEQMRQLEQADLLVSLISSGAALHGLQGQLSQTAWRRVRSAPMVVPSPRLVEQAADLGCCQVFRAEGADDAAMLRCLHESALAG